MERKIGETFGFEGKWLKVQEGESLGSCEHCYFEKEDCSRFRSFIGVCTHNERNDKKGVIFEDITYKPEENIQAEQPQKQEQQDEETEEPKEREIGEVFEYEGKKLKVVKTKGSICNNCYFENRECSCENISKVTGACLRETRSDNNPVIFMEVKEEPEKQPQKKQLPKEEHLQELNLCEILKDCPRGEMFWSPVFGDVKLCEINYNEKEISVRLKTGKTCWINSDATLTYSGIKSEESMLYPSREQRDWTKVKYEKKKELPKTWEEFCKNYAIKDGECYMDDCCDLIDADCEGHTRDAQSDRNILPSNVAAKTHLALMQLHQLRDCYRDGWLPNGISAVHGIERYYDPSNGVVKLRVIKLYCPSKFLSFQTEERAKEFFNNFRELIEQADDLI